MTLEPGQILDGKYRILRSLGGGAMGQVFEGENLRIHRRVAIKVLHPAHSNRADTVQRFEREAQAAGRIGSEHIVEVLDLGSLPDGALYMVMEFLDGVTLGQRIHARGRLAPRDVVPTIQQLLTGLEAAHAARVVHRDLKPDNVFLCREVAGQRDFVKILDFGVSKFNPLDGEMSMTTTGSVVGTPFYMAPEQAKGAKDIDHRCDLYSVGVILYEAITGQKPFHAGTFNELLFKIVLETPAPPETFVPDLDPAFGRIVRRAMAREAGDRYQTAAELRDALSVWLHTGRDRDHVPPAAPPAFDGSGTIVVDGDLPGSVAPPLEEGLATRVFEPAEMPPAWPGHRPDEPEALPRAPSPTASDQPFTGSAAAPPTLELDRSRLDRSRLGLVVAAGVGLVLVVAAAFVATRETPRATSNEANSAPAATSAPAPAPEPRAPGDAGAGGPDAIRAVEEPGTTAPTPQTRPTATARPSPTQTVPTPADPRARGRRIKKDL